MAMTKGVHKQGAWTCDECALDGNCSQTQALLKRSPKMDPLEKEIRLLADARDRLYALGVQSPICDDLDNLIDQKIEAEWERIQALSEEELIAECQARGEDYHQKAEDFRAKMLASFDAARNHN